MKKFFFSLIILPFVLASAEERAPVGERLQTSDESEQQSLATESEETAGCCCDAWHLNYYPICSHWIYTIMPLKDSLGIEDGSIWDFDPWQTYWIRNWVSNDQIVITQNHEWFSSYQYCIVNQNLGSSIPANLSLGPIIEGEYAKYSRCIVEIDYMNGVLILSDQSRWIVSSRDRCILNKWILNDFIITGVNTGWDSSCPFILINANANNFIRAKQF